MAGTFFNANSFALSRSMVGVMPNRNGGDIYKEPPQDINRFQKLYINVLNKIKIDINRFSECDFINLNNSITNNFAIYFKDINNKNLYYNEKITNFEGFSYDVNVFNSYINIMNNILTGLQKGSNLQITNDTLTQDISNNKLGIGIELDEIIIKNFFLNRDREIIPFAETELYKQNLEFKLWYTIYFQEIGPPINGIFDVDKLAKIVNKLIEQGYKV